MHVSIVSFLVIYNYLLNFHKSFFIEYMFLHCHIIIHKNVPHFRSNTIYLNNKEYKKKNEN